MTTKRALLNAAADVKTESEARAVFNITLELSDKKAPSELRLFKMGENDTLQGKFLLTDDAAKRVMERAKDWGNKFHFDWDHAAALTANGVKAPAAAWYDLELRKDGLYATNIEWTPDGERDVLSKSYRYLSPNILYNEKTREVTRFENAALTNLPAGKQLEALLSIPASVQPKKEEKTMERKALLSLLGLPETTSDAELHEKMAQLNQFKAQVLAQTGAKSEVESIGALLSMKQGASQAQELAKKLEEQRAAQVTADRTALLSQAEKDGKLPPGSELRKYLEDKDLELVRATLSQLPVLPKSKTPPKKEDVRQGAEGGSESDADEVKATLSQEQLAAAKKAASWFDVKAKDVEEHWAKLAGGSR